MAQANPVPGAASIREAVAVFHDPKALQEAVSDLQGHGFDRAEISFIAREGFSGQVAEDYREAGEVKDKPDVAREAPTDETDIRQRRTLEISMAATIAAFAAVGFTVLSGGATAVAAGVGVVAAGGVGGLGALLGRLYGQGQERYVREQIDRGGVLLWVRTKDAEAERRALDVLRRHAAVDAHVHEVPAGATGDD
jgi:hypothetical protein